MFVGPRRFAAVLVVFAVALTACGSGGAKDASSAAPSAPASTASPAPNTTATTTGVKVGGGYAVTPTVTVPATAAPAALTQQTIVQGSGAVVAKGDTLVADYSGQTWAEKNGKVNVFDSSFTRGSPAAFQIGVGAVIPGWDKTLVGKKLGSRVLLTVPPADGYGSDGQSAANISGTDTLVFVVDLVAAYKPDASAPGVAVAGVPTAGLPKVENPVGKQPTVLSTTGVKVPTAPTSTLLVAGSGAKIDSKKTLVLQLVETDLATGKNTQSTWGHAPQSDPASSVFTIADKLSGQNVGSRAVVLLPAVPAAAATATAAARPATPPSIVIIDVVGQF